MRCPKDKTDLVAAKLTDNDLNSWQCLSCRGNWISVVDYEAWQGQQVTSHAEREPLDCSLDFVPSPFDTKAGLCPECGSYLARAKIALKQPFYIERCSCCGGIWCDEGEWDVLEKLNLHVSIPQLFSSKWQMQMREVKQSEQERQILIDKLGADLAKRLFELADVLEKHEHGDFAAAYIMRRFERDKPEQRPAKNERS